MSKSKSIIIDLLNCDLPEFLFEQTQLEEESQSKLVFDLIDDMYLVQNIWNPDVAELSYVYLECTRNIHKQWFELYGRHLRACQDLLFLSNHEYNNLQNEWMKDVIVKHFAPKILGLLMELEVILTNKQTTVA